MANKPCYFPTEYTAPAVVSVPSFAAEHSSSSKPYVGRPGYWSPPTRNRTALRNHCGLVAGRTAGSESEEAYPHCRSLAPDQRRIVPASLSPVGACRHLTLCEIITI